MTFSSTRRALLAGAAASAASAPMHGARADDALPGAPVTVGDFTVTPLADGLIPIPLSAFPDAEGPEGRGLLEAAGQPGAGPVSVPVRAYAIRRGDRLWLVDTGCGALLGPELGRVAAALGPAGIDPATVEVVILTHLHPDHVGA